MDYDTSQWIWDSFAPQNQPSINQPLFINDIPSLMV